MQLEGVRVVKVPLAGDTNKLVAADVVVVGSVVVEISFVGEGLLADRAVI
jgi:hypothetical protein